METNPNTLTERLFIDAGVGPGMHVLDIGCGHGEVSRSVSRLVGASGRVVGLDRDQALLEVARERSAAQGLESIAFVCGDLLGELPELGLFDAIVGRRVLMYLPDAADTLRRLGSYLKPDGRLVFQEFDATVVPVRVGSWPLHDRITKLLWQMVEREGGNLHMGLMLQDAFQRAGFLAEHVRADAIVVGQGTHYALAQIVRAVMPRLVHQGVVTEGELDLQTLETQLDEERQANRASYVSDLSFGAWGSRAPG